MSKFCVNCGTQLPEEANACPNCGAAVEAKKVEKKKSGNAFFAKVKAIFKKCNDAVAAKLKSFGIPVKAFYIALAVLLVLVVVFSIFANGYKTPIKRYLDIEYKGKYQKIEKMLPDAYLEYLAKRQDRDPDSVLEDIIEEAKLEWEGDPEDKDDDGTKGSLKERYGKNYKVSYKILYEDKLKGKELEEIQESLKSRYDIAKSSIKTVYEMYVKVTIKGSEDEQSYKSLLYSINIDGKWYLINGSGSFPYN